MVGNSLMVPASWAESAAASQDFEKSAAAFLQKIPKEIASIERIHFGPGANSQTPFVIHIQDAHAVPSAQKNIARLLAELRKQFPELAVAVEGAQGALRPDYLDLFPKYPEANRALRDEWTAQGELSGAELFAWDLYESSKKSRVLSPNLMRIFGMEEANAYRENFEIYREFLKNRSDIDTRLIRIQNEIQTEGSKLLSPALRDFLKERERRKRGHYETRSPETNPDLAAYLPYLKRQVLQNLAIDLSDSVEQLRFPHLVRFFYVQESQATNPLEKAKSEWQSLLQDLRTSAQKDSERTLFQALDLFGRKFPLFSGSRDGAFPNASDLLSARSLWNKLEQYRKPSKKYPRVLQALKSWILLHEINASKLMEETGRLETALMNHWARTDEEKSWLQKFEALSRMESFLHLEITHAELFQILDDAEFHKNLIRTLDPLSRGLSFWMDRAFRFYEVALQRDGLMLDRALEKKEVPVLVMIAGGFHSEGITQLLENRGYSFAVLQPSMTAASPLLYDSVMAGSHADLSAYFHEASPFATKRAAILFKSILELGTPVLFSRYGLTSEQVTHEIVRAVTEHPVLHEAVLAKKVAAGNALSIRFEPRVSSPAPERFTVTSELLASETALVSNKRQSSSTAMTLAYVKNRPEIRISRLETFHFKSDTVLVQSGLLNPEMMNKSRFPSERSELRMQTLSAIDALLQFANESQNIAQLKGEEEYEEFTRIRTAALNQILESIPSYQNTLGVNVTLAGVVDYLLRLGREGLIAALEHHPDDQAPKKKIPGFPDSLDVANWLYGNTTGRKGILTDHPPEIQREKVEAIFIESLMLKSGQRMYLSAAGNLRFFKVWVLIFDRLAQYAARGTSPDALKSGQLELLTSLTVATAGFRAELRKMAAENGRIPVARENLGFLDPMLRMTQQNVRVAAARLMGTSAGRISRDQVLGILAKHLGPNHKAFLSQAERPVQLRIPEFETPRVEKYHAAFLVLLLNPQNEVMIHAAISKQAAADFNELLAAEAVRWGIEPAGRIRIVGEGSEKAVLASGSAKRSETRMSPLAMGLLLLKSNLEFQGKFSLNATASFLSGEYLEDSAAILLSALLPWNTLKQQVGTWYSLYRGMISKGVDASEIGTRLAAALQEIRATLQSA